MKTETGDERWAQLQITLRITFIVPKLLSKFLVETRTELLDGACGGQTQPAVFHSSGTPRNFLVENLPPSTKPTCLHIWWFNGMLALTIDKLNAYNFLEVPFLCIV